MEYQLVFHQHISEADDTTRLEEFKQSRNNYDTLIHQFCLIKIQLKCLVVEQTSNLKRNYVMDKIALENIWKHMANTKHII